MLPIVLNLRSRRVLVVGAGPVGLRKARAAVDAGGQVLLVDPVPPSFEIGDPLISRIVEPYSSRHLEGMALVFACATPEVNAQVVSEAHTRHILVCDSAEPSRGDFHLPSVVRRGEFLLAVSTGGAAPRLARRIAARLADEFDDSSGDWVRILGEVRRIVLDTIPDAEVRRVWFERFSEPHWWERVRTAGAETAKAEMIALLSVPGTSHFP
jgi:precorrin-2 dehydrogenase/sirohydrochlorin ferrochelatase